MQKKNPKNKKSIYHMTSRQEDRLFLVIPGNVMSLLIRFIWTVNKVHFFSPEWSNKLIQQFILLFVTEHVLIQAPLSFRRFPKAFLSTATLGSYPSAPVQAVKSTDHWARGFVFV
jgi:hypothetical protein